MALARIQAERNSGDRKESAILKAIGKRRLKWLAVAAALLERAHRIDPNFVSHVPPAAAAGERYPALGMRTVPQSD